MTFWGLSSEATHTTSLIHMDDEPTLLRHSRGDTTLSWCRPERPWRHQRSRTSRKSGEKLKTAKRAREIQNKSKQKIRATNEPQFLNMLYEHAVDLWSFGNDKIQMLAGESKSFSKRKIHKKSKQKCPKWRVSCTVPFARTVSKRQRFTKRDVHWDRCWISEEKLRGKNDSIPHKCSHQHPKQPT